MRHWPSPEKPTESHGGEVGFTNRCFDILHQAHAYLLQFARHQRDLLILGLRRMSFGTCGSLDKNFGKISYSRLDAAFRSAFTLRFA